jgi:hypothetical protein
MRDGENKMITPKANRVSTLTSRSHINDSSSATAAREATTARSEAITEGVTWVAVERSALLIVV